MPQKSCVSLVHQIRSHRMSLYHITDNDFDHLVKEVSSGKLFHCKIIIFPFLLVFLEWILWDYVDILFFIKLSHTCFSIHWWFLPQLFLWCLSSGDFLAPLFPLYFLLAFYYEEKLFLPHLSFNSFIYIRVNDGFILILILKWSQSWPGRAPADWLLCLFGVSPSLLVYFLTFWLYLSGSNH